MKFQSDFFIRANEIECDEVGEGLKRRILGYNDNLMMVQVIFNKGAVGVLHKHFHSQTTYVAKGKFQITIGDQKEILQTGDSFFVPPDIEHEAVCLEEGILLDVFNPLRVDFIKN